ncbi:MAG: hypothetical protein K8L99_11475 [Anaerolineae bacterium]|nr:hypothetical protein [Anaerolineae bacterium]
MQKLIIVVLSILALLFLSALVYSKTAGEWAGSLVMPLPESSQLVAEAKYSTPLFHNKLRVYRTDHALYEVREWYVSNGTPMSPIDGVLTKEDTTYISLPQSFTRSEYNLLFTAALLSANAKLGNYETYPDCFYVQVFRTLEDVGLADFDSLFPELGEETFLDGTILVIQSCWPNW